MTGAGPDRILVARHGETAWNRERRIQGWAPTALTDRGHRQAAALGEHLAQTYDVGHVVASDLRRTRETAAHLAEAGLPAATFDDAWRERNFGMFQGFDADALFDRYPEFDAKSSVVALDSRPERGESLVDLHRRVVGAWEDVLALDHDTILVVAHGGPLHVLHGHVNGEDLLTAFANHSHDNCALSEFRLDEDVEVVCKNECVWTMVSEGD